MIKLKPYFLLLISIVMLGCGGSNNEAPDFTTFTDGDMLALAINEQEQGKYEDAISHYNKLLLEFPTSNLHIKAQLKIAECYAAMDKWEDQFDTLKRLVRENIIPEEVPQLYVQIGKFYERAAQFNPGVITTDSADYNLAMDYYDKALKYPDSDDNLTKSESVYRRALVEAKIGKINDAVARYKMVSNLFPTSDFSILSQMKLKDPNNTSELITTDSALTRYKQALGLLEKDEDFEEDTAEEKVDQELESTIDALDQDSQENPDETNDLENMNDENILEGDTEENPEEENYYEENSNDFLEEDTPVDDSETENNDSENIHIDSEDGSNDIENIDE